MDADGRTGQHPLFRDGGISYLHIPAPDPALLAWFYADAFGWTLTGSDRLPGFEDGTGHVIGKFVTNQGVTGEDGMRPYVYVADLHAALARVVAGGGEVVTAPYPEGDLWVATFRDPAGNLVGAWQLAWGTAPGAPG